MAASWHDLLANFTIVAAFVAVWIYLQGWVARLDPMVQTITLGLLMGLGSIGAMVFSAALGPGLLLDLRVSPLALAGFFGGPLAGLIAGVMALLCRLYFGGAGLLPGSITIAVATLIGIGGYYACRRIRLGGVEILALSTLVGIGSLVSYVAVPSAALSPAVTATAMPGALLAMLATLILGLAMHIENRRRELLASNNILEAAFLGLPDCLNVKDTQGRFVIANPATAKLMNAESASALIGKTDQDFYQSEIAAQFRRDEEQMMLTGEPIMGEQLVSRADGHALWLSTLKAPLRDPQGNVVGIITHNRDVSEQRRLKEDLDQTRQHLADALDHMADALVMFDRDEKLIFCNRQYVAMFPMTADIRVPNVAFTDILRTAVERGEETPGEAELETWINLRRTQLHTGGERLIQLKDGRWIQARTRISSDGRSLIVFSDITDRKHAEDALGEANERLAALAATDGLTSLMNRRSFDQALDREFARALRDGSPLAILIVDVDRFKAFNDTYGHLAGDDCLKALSRCIEDTFRRPADVVARFGGEEFAVLLPNTTPAGAYHLALQLRLAIRNLGIPHSAGEHGIVTASIGVAAAAAKALSGEPEDMVLRADEALYAAKAAGRDRVRAADEQRLAEQPSEHQQLRR